MSILFRQLPARSPLSFEAAATAAVHVTGVRRDPRPRLERMLRERFGADGVRLCGSGTHALQLALSAIREACGEQVVALLPAYTCFEVATAAVGARIRVALYDIDPETLQPDWDSVHHAARGHAVGALVVAPLYGMPVDWSRAKECANDLGALLVEDAAQAHGSTAGGRHVGSVGDLSIISFGRGKGWTGMGGGALLWRDAGRSIGENAARRPLAPKGTVSQIATLLKALALWLLGRPSLYALPAAIPWLRLGETIYHEPTAPAEMSRVSAAMVLATCAASDAEALTRRRHAREYDEALQSSRMASRPDGEAPGALRYPVLIEGGWASLPPSDIRLGAGPPYPAALADLDAAASLLVNPQAAHAGAARLVNELITLPTHGLTSASERARLVDALATRLRRPVHS